jgi:hypothetical protein
MLVVAGVVMVGCSDPNDPEDTCAQDADCAQGQRCEQATGQCVDRPEDRDLLCTAASDCLATELCHPTAGACVQTCESSADCPSSAKTCAPLSATDSRKVCQCSTDALCNADRQNANLVCSNVDHVCTPRCDADTDCGSGRTCDTATGQCKPRDIQSCTASSDCLASELCHPTAGVCVQTCESAASCPDSAKTCAALSATDSRKVCQCSTDLVCNTGRNTPELVCSNLDHVCTPRCTSDVDCGSGRTCDTATGQCGPRGIRLCQLSSQCLASELCHPTAGICVQTCVSGAECPDSAKTCATLSATDSRRVCQCATDALCNAGGETADQVCSDLDNVCVAKCTGDSDCGTERRCNPATGQCQEDSTHFPCTGEGQSICDYGTQHCVSGQCAPLPGPPSCLNYTNLSRKDDLGTTGPILYGVRLVGSVLDTNFCAQSSPKRVRIALSAYNSRPFPTTRFELAGFFYVRGDGTRVDGTQLVSPASAYTVTGENRERAELIVSLCVPQDSTGISTGFYFIGGNFLCFQANYPASGEP